MWERWVKAGIDEKQEEGSKAKDFVAQFKYTDCNKAMCIAYLIMWENGGANVRAEKRVRKCYMMYIFPPPVFFSFTQLGALFSTDAIDILTKGK